MNTHRLTLSAATSCAMLAACTQMPDPVGITSEEGSPIVVSVTASDGLQTRGVITGTTLGASPFRLTNYSGTMKVPSEAISLYRSQWYLTDVGYLGWKNYRWGLIALTEGE